MGFCCGIVGLPNVGKSTIFNALTAAEIESANYPFCTIEPNVGKVPVPDERLDKLAELANTQRTVYAQMEFVDIAGLVSGASKGEGLGNQFLGHIRQVDAIAHVIRCFEDDNVVHVDGSVDPIRDREVINTELILSDLDTVEKRLKKTISMAKSGDKVYKKQVVLLEEIQKVLDEGKAVRSMTFEEADQPAVDQLMKDLCLLTSKPVLYVANVSEDDIVDGNAMVDILRKTVEEEEMAPVVVISGAIEEELAALGTADQGEYLSELGLDESGLNRMIKAGYKLLGLTNYFTVGEKETRSWTIPVGAKAPKAASAIHTDFERGFIRAEIISYEDFIASGSEAAAKEKGLWRLEGKDYVVQDGDCINFRFNV